MANGQDSGIVLSSEVGACGRLANFLAGDAASHDVFRVLHGGGLVKTCSECLGHEHLAARVVPS